MSAAIKLLKAAAGNAGGAVYVDDVFSCFLYEGNATSRSIVNGIDLADKGGLVWTKNRDTTYDHNFVDSARGLTNSPYIRSNSANSQGTDGNGITAFNSNGYTVGNSASWNANGNSHVSWTFAKQKKFFDIVTYSGNATNGRAINHNLGSTPGMIIVKSKTSSTYWAVYHRSLGEGHYLFLNTTDAKSAYDSNSSNSRYWNNTAPTSTQFTVSNDGWVNGSGQDYVAYLFAHNEADYGENSDEAIIECGSYTGTGSAGNSINLGFEPQWLMIKQSSGANDWYIYDTMRGIVSGGNDAVGLKANSEDAEGSSNHLSVTATGFELEGTGGGYNGSGQTYVYMAIRRPHKPASEFATTDLFAIDTAGSTGDGNEPHYRSTFACDMGIRVDINEASKEISSRLMHGTWMYTDQNAAASSPNFPQFDYSNGWGAASSTNADSLSYMFRRVKGFFDVVTYVGDGTTSHAVNHNLGVAPELIILKDRDRGANWSVYHQNSPVSGSGKRYNLKLNVDNAAGDSDFWPSTPTATQFVLGDSDQGVNRNGDDYIAYLFATADGISKVGGYTGTGSDLNVDCGFSAGARFILIKRTDSSGDWYVYDSVRGIVAGNDPYTLLNTTAAQVTNTDYIDPLSAGFTVTSSAPAGLNASSGNYIFLAIA